MNNAFYPSPAGQLLCNKLSTLKTQLIHNLSTSVRFAVDNTGRLIHNSFDLSTKTVDKPPYLWIKIYGLSYSGNLNDYITIQSVDKPVDKRGKICG
jgi:hypothetical protein